MNLVGGAVVGDHNKAGEGIYASPSSMAGPKTWELVKDKMAVVMNRGRRGSALGLGGGLGGLVSSLGGGGMQALMQADPLDPPCGLEPQLVNSMLGKVPWFHAMRNTDLRTLLGRGRVCYFPRDAVVVRENSFGTAFYVLLRGEVFAASKRRNFDVSLTTGMSFGETALAPQCDLRREATVVALEDTWCFSITARDLIDLANNGLDEVQNVLVAKMLATVNWFDLLVPTKLLEVAQLLEVENYAAGRPVFPQGAMADKMYIVVKGSVGIFLSLPPKEADAEWVTNNKMLAEFTKDSKAPWFGEAALFAVFANEQPKRGAGAFTLQRTQLLSVHVSMAKKFIECLPQFADMNKVALKSYSKMNAINHNSTKISAPVKKVE